MPSVMHTGSHFVRKLLEHLPGVSTVIMPQDLSQTTNSYLGKRAGPIPMLIRPQDLLRSMRPDDSIVCYYGHIHQPFIRSLIQHGKFSFMMVAPMRHPMLTMMSECRKNNGYVSNAGVIGAYLDLLWVLNSRHSLVIPVDKLANTMPIERLEWIDKNLCKPLGVEMARNLQDFVEAWTPINAGTSETLCDKTLKECKGMIDSADLIEIIRQTTGIIYR